MYAFVYGKQTQRKRFLRVCINTNYSIMFSNNLYHIQVYKYIKYSVILSLFVHKLKIYKTHTHKRHTDFLFIKKGVCLVYYIQLRSLLLYTKE